MKLYIAEKPSLARTLAETLGKGKSIEGGIEGHGWIVTWCFGHMYEQYQPHDYEPGLKSWSLNDLPIVPDVWKIKPRKETKKQISIIKNHLKNAQTVINVGDPDREGQLLIDELLQELKWNGNTLRLWLTDLTDKGIINSIEAIKKNTEYVGILNSALVRQRADWLIGINLTRYYTIIAQKNNWEGVLSVGRVQTPTLALVVERDLQIENFISKPFYEIQGSFNHKNGTYKGTVSINEELLDEEGRLQNKARAIEIIESIKSTDGIITNIDVKEKKNNPPLCYSLSDLQSDASKELGLSAKKTLDIAQSLYETHKISTYPRSDCGYLSENQFDDSYDILTTLSNVEGLYEFVNKTQGNLKSKVFNDSKTTAHTAIIPTGKKPGENLTKDEKNVFHLICKRYIAQFYQATIVEETSFSTIVDDWIFQSKGFVIKQVGWMQLYPKKDKNDSAHLPIVSDNELSILEKKKIVEKNTSAPKRFTEGTLIKAMANIARYFDSDETKKILKESEGIGTEATRASIIETLKNRKFLVDDKKNILSTSTAREFIKMLPETITSAITTAEWEGELSKIENNTIDMDSFLFKQVAFLNTLIKKNTEVNIGTQEKAISCPECSDGQLSKKKGKTGWFWGCSNYQKDCKETFVDINEMPFVEKFACFNCDGQLKLLSGKYGNYFKCNSCGNNFKENGRKPVITNKVPHERHLINVMCPICETSKLMKSYSENKKKNYYPCSDHGCTFISFENKKKELTYIVDGVWHILGKL